MREILFRGKKLDKDEWVCGCIDCRPDQKIYIINYRKDKHGIINTEEYRVIPETAGQYIGLTDKNGIKIFEGDVIKIHHRFFMPKEQYSHTLELRDEYDYYAKVVYKEGSYVLEDITKRNSDIYIDTLLGHYKGNIVLGEACFEREFDNMGWLAKTEDRAIEVAGNIHEFDIDEIKNQT